MEAWAVGIAALAVAWMSYAGMAWAAEGDLDLSFGNGGRVVTPVPVGAGATENAMTIDAQGRIVVVGDVSHGDQDMLVARFSAERSAGPGLQR